MFVYETYQHKLTLCHSPALTDGSVHLPRSGIPAKVNHDWLCCDVAKLCVCACVRGVIPGDGKLGGSR